MQHICYNLCYSLCYYLCYSLSSVVVLLFMLLFGSPPFFDDSEGLGEDEKIYLKMIGLKI